MDIVCVILFNLANLINNEKKPGFHNLSVNILKKICHFNYFQIFGKHIIFAIRIHKGISNSWQERKVFLEILLKHIIKSKDIATEVFKTAITENKSSYALMTKH